VPIVQWPTLVGLYFEAIVEKEIVQWPTLVGLYFEAIVEKETRCRVMCP